MLAAHAHPEVLTVDKPLAFPAGSFRTEPLRVLYIFNCSEDRVSVARLVT
jgi:hypothetical protein